MIDGNILDMQSYLLVKNSEVKNIKGRTRSEKSTRSESEHHFLAHMQELQALVSFSEHLSVNFSHFPSSLEPVDYFQPSLVQIIFG